MLRTGAAGRHGHPGDAGFAVVDGPTLRANAVKCVAALGLTADSQANATIRGQLNPRLYWQCAKRHERAEALRFEVGTRWVEKQGDEDQVAREEG